MNPLNVENKKFATARRKIVEFFGGDLSIVDAKVPLTLLPNEEDLETAVANDSRKCVTANCLHRQVGSSGVLVFKRSVYLNHLGSDGVMRIYRYQPSRALYDLITAFDGGKVTKDDVLRSFLLNPPAKANRLEAQSKQRRKWRRTPSGKAIEAARQAQLKVKTLARDLETSKTKLSRLRDEKGVSPKVTEAKKQVERVMVALKKARDTASEKQERANEARAKHDNQGRQRPRRQQVRTSQRHNVFLAAMQKAA